MILFRPGISWGRILVVVLVLVLACGLMASGHDLATAVLLSAAVLGTAADIARRLVPARPAQGEA
jgi:hypothetical protein